VHGTSTQNGCAWVLDAKVFGVRWRVVANIKGSITSIPRCLFELEFSLGIIRMLDPKVPSRGFVISRFVEVEQVCVRRIVTLVATRLDQDS
jgi:hypothetical protein